MSRISPVSMPLSIMMVVTPDFFSPLRIARWIGAAPRYFGKSDECRFMQNCVGILRKVALKICPNATTIITSGRFCFNDSINSGSLTVFGCSMGRSESNAYCLIGETRSFCLRPFGLSGCVMTASIECEDWCRDFRVGSANSGVPIKIMFLHPAL